MAVPTHSDVQFKIRIPADLKSRVDAAAQANSRSTTAEIVAVLEREYPTPVPAGLESLADRFSSIVVGIVQSGGDIATIEAAIKDATLDWLQDPLTTEEQREALRNAAPSWPLL